MKKLAAGSEVDERQWSGANIIEFHSLPNWKVTQKIKME